MPEFKLSHLNTALAGLLILGSADLIWLNGWLVPSLLAKSSDTSPKYSENAPQKERNKNQNDKTVADIVKNGEQEKQKVIVPQETADILEAKPNKTDLNKPTVAVKDNLPSTPEEKPLPDFNLHILFSSNSDKLSKSIVADLHKTAQTIIGTKHRVQITGHTDARGDEERNEELGSRRAEIVSKKLQALGVPQEQIETRSMGERAPIANANFYKQRRVEIHLIKGE